MRLFRRRWVRSLLLERLDHLVRLLRQLVTLGVDLRHGAIDAPLVLNGEESSEDETGREGGEELDHV